MKYLTIIPLAVCWACSAPADPLDDNVSVFAAIAPDERIDFLDTEPFWGGHTEGSSLLYTTPEDIEGRSIFVERFAGNNGLGLSGTLAGKAFDMTVTPGECSDAMSDRTYPYTVTLQIGQEIRYGCAWTEDQPFIGARTP